MGECCINSKDVSANDEEVTHIHFGTTGPVCRDLPCARTEVKINYHTDKGRYLTVSKDIEPGKILEVSFFTPLQNRS